MKTLALVLLIISPKIYCANLTIKMEEVQSDKGFVSYILFKGPKGFPDDEKTAFKKGSMDAKMKSFELKNIPEGEYAMTFIHDENGNGKLDTRLGLPSEGFGFSNNPLIFFGPPSFERTLFKIENSNKSIVIKMKYL